MNGSEGSNPQVLVVQPDPADPLDRWDEWLRESGVGAEVVRPYLGEALPRRVVGSGLVVLGGAMSVHDTHDHPWLDSVGALLRDAVDANVPTIGICLGVLTTDVRYGGAPGDG